MTIMLCTACPALRSLLIVISVSSNDDGVMTTSMVWAGAMTTSMVCGNLLVGHAVGHGSSTMLSVFAGPGLSLAATQLLLLPARAGAPTNSGWE